LLENDDYDIYVSMTMNNETLEASSKNEIRINRFQIQLLIFLTSIFFLNFTIRIIVSPLLPTISMDMGLTYDQGGSFFLISASGYFISLLCSGFVSSRIGHKKTIVLSAIVAGIAFVLTGLSQNLISIRTGLFIVGMAAALYFPSGMALLTSSIDQRNWGKAIGIHELAPNLSFLLSPMICEGLLLFFSWRSVLFVIGAMSILFGLFFAKFSKVKDSFGEAPLLKSFLPLMTTPSFWMMIVLFSLGVIGTLGVYSMLPLFLVSSHGMLQSQANSLITISRILTLPMPFFIGWLSDRFGLKLTLSMVLFLSGISVLLLGLLSGRLIQIAVFCQSMLGVCFFPPAFAALSRIGSKKIQNIVISFTIPIAFLVGGGIVPNIIGLLGSHGLFHLGFIAFGGFIILGAAIPLFLKFRKDNIDRLR
jgi:NNP family nitrate/nitrite transporter-like MFS transporter